MNMKSYLKFLSRNKLYTAIEAVGLTLRTKCGCSYRPNLWDIGSEKRGKMLLSSPILGH